MKALISAKLITYNRAHRLRETLRAWNSGALRDIPLEVLDNASTDETAQVVLSARAENPNITSLRHELNIGAVGNLLRAYERFESEYCWILCDDDVFDGSAVPSFLDRLRGDSDVIVVGNVGVFDNHRGFLGKCSDYLAQGGQFYVVGSFLPNIIFRSEYLKGGVLFKCYKAAGSLYPHLSLIEKLVSVNALVSVVERPVISRIPNDDVKSAGTYWLYESIFASRYLGVEARVRWNGEVIRFLRQGNLRKALGYNIGSRACGALVFSRAAEMSRLLSSGYFGLKLILFSVSLLPCWFCRLLMSRRPGGAVMDNTVGSMRF